MRCHHYFWIIHYFRGFASIFRVTENHHYFVKEQPLFEIEVVWVGRTGLDKVQAHIHQTWLEYGPTMRSLTRANSVVRQCLSDRGTEFGIADVADVTHERLLVACMRE